MTVVDVRQDDEALRFVLEARFDAGVERVWRLVADPRRLERWWGPPHWPATVERFELEPGGLVHYFMTGPDGERARGRWTVTSVAPPGYLAFDDEFADEEWSPQTELGTTHGEIVLRADDDGAGTLLTLTTRFDSAEQLAQMSAMGMAEGITAAVGQMDGLLAER